MQWRKLAKQLLQRYYQMRKFYKEEEVAMHAALDDFVIAHDYLMPEDVRRVIAHIGNPDLRILADIVADVVLPY